MSHAERALHRAQELRGRLDRRRRVLLRDFLIFELKLLLDSLKGLLISQAALVALIIDLLRPGGQDRRVFYKVLNLGERADSWLSLYGASERAAADPEGLLGVSREGSNTLLGTPAAIVSASEYSQLSRVWCGKPAIRSMLMFVIPTVRRRTRSSITMARVCNRPTLDDS